MKNFAFALLLLLSSFVPAAAMETYYMPLAETLLTEVPPHLVPKNATINASNFVFDNGNIRKRPGFSEVYTFDGTIKGYFPATPDYSLVVANNGESGAAAGSQIWEWNLYGDPDDASFEMNNLNDTHLTNPGILFEETETWNFTNHYDPVVGAVTVATSGDDYLQKYIHADQVTDGIYYVTQTRHIDHLTSVDPFKYVKGKFPVSYYNSLYLGYVTADYGTSPVTETADATGIIYSTINDASDFSDPDYYIQRTEGGDEITGGRTINDSLIWTKEESIWEMRAYDQFRQLTNRYGATNFDGIVSSDSMYVTYYGRVLDALNGTWLSWPINTLFSSRAPGSWEYSGKADRHNERLAWSAGQFLFIYDKVTKSWQQWKFGKDIKLLDVQNPGKPWAQWLPIWRYYTAESFAEIDTSADFVISYNDRTLMVKNHFSFDGTYDAQRPIECVYDTRLDAAEQTSWVKRWQMVTIQGGPNQGPITIYASFNNSATAPIDYGSALGTITLNEHGYGELAIDNRSVWISLRLKESSTNALEISKIGLKFTLHTQRIPNT